MEGGKEGVTYVTEVVVLNCDCGELDVVWSFRVGVVCVERTSTQSQKSTYLRGFVRAGMVTSVCEDVV